MSCLGVQGEHNDQVGQHTLKNTLGQMRQVWIRTANGTKDLKYRNCILRMSQSGWFKDEKTSET